MFNNINMLRNRLQAGGNFGSLGATNPVQAPFMGQLAMATAGQGMPTVAPPAAPSPVMGLRPLNYQI